MVEKNDDKIKCSLAEKSRNRGSLLFDPLTPINGGGNDSQAICRDTKHA